MKLETGDGQTYEKPLASGAPSPEQESERDERRAEIESIVLNLAPAYRELIVLRHAHDLSYDEIAEVTGLPLGTVKNESFARVKRCAPCSLERGITSM